MHIFKRFQTIGIYAALLIIIVIFSFSSDTFLTFKNGVNILRQVSSLGIMAVGMTFVMISGGVDLSVGTQLSIFGIITANAMVNWHLHPVFAVLIGAAAVVAIGTVNGIMVTRTGIPPMIATLGMMQIVKGLSYTICAGLPIFGFPEGFSFLGQGSIGIIPIPIIILAICIAIGAFVLNKTSYGRSVYAVGSNSEASRLSGINVRKVKLLTYVIASAFTAVASLITLSRLNAGQVLSGLGQEMDVLTAVVLGGIIFTGGEGLISGVVAGVLIIGVLSNGLVMMGVGEYVQLIIKGGVLLFALSMEDIKKMFIAKFGQQGKM